MFRMPISPLELIGGGALLMHVDRAVKHQRYCAQCAGRDFVAITLDVPHLWSTNPVASQDSAPSTTTDSAAS